MLYSSMPYTDLHELNLDWILNEMKKLISKMENFVDDFESIQIGDPFIHDMSYSYPANAIVIDGNGVAYLSKQVVPIGKPLSDTDYWISVGAFAYYRSDTETLYIPGRIGAGGAGDSHTIIGDILTITEG